MRWFTVMVLVIIIKSHNLYPNHYHLLCSGTVCTSFLAAEKRIKEIGIRKTLGASQLSIVYLLSAGFTRIILFSLLAGIPVSFFITWRWLNNFAYRITLSPVYFIEAMAVILLVGWLTIALQTIKASMANPVKCLSGE